MAASMGKYANAEVFCTNKNMGCSWKGFLKELDEHVTTCDKNILRDAIISIQRLEARLDEKDREAHFLKNNFALKIEHISKERRIKAKVEFDKFETLAARIKDELDEVKEQNKDDKEVLEEEIKNIKDETKQNKNEIKKLKDEIEQLKKENGGLRKELETSTGDKVPETQNTIAITTVIPTTTTSSVSEILQNPSVTKPISKAYFDLVDGGEPLGRVVVNLFIDQAPNNCAKFIKLCTHETGVGYRGSGVWSLGSDYCGLGDEKKLTYPASNRMFPEQLRTPVENKSAKHDRSRLVSLENSGGFTGSRFLLMFQRYRTSDARGLVIIGEVTGETWSIVEKTREGGKNRKNITIADCGVIE